MRHLLLLGKLSIIEKKKIAQVVVRIKLFFQANAEGYRRSIRYPCAMNPGKISPSYLRKLPAYLTPYPSSKNLFKITMLRVGKKSNQLHIRKHCLFSLWMVQQFLFFFPGKLETGYCQYSSQFFGDPVTVKHQESPKRLFRCRHPLQCAPREGSRSRARPNNGRAHAQTNHILRLGGINFASASIYFGM